MDFGNILDDLFLKLNQCRLHPQETVVTLQQLRNQYKGNVFKQKYKTRQGQAALNNLITDLSRRQPVPRRLKWSFALHMAADEQAKTLGQQGLYTTEGTLSHIPLPQRVKDYAVVKGRISQVYQFGGRSADEILEELLIDDGLSSRKRRSTLLDPIYNYIGIGSSFHDRNQVCTVIILAEDIMSLVAPDQSGNYIRRGQPTEKQMRIKMTEQIFLDMFGKPIQPIPVSPTVMSNNSLTQSQVRPINPSNINQSIRVTPTQPLNQTIQSISNNQPLNPMNPMNQSIQSINNQPMNQSFNNNMIPPNPLQNSRNTNQSVAYNPNLGVLPAPSNPEFGTLANDWANIRNSNVGDLSGSGVGPNANMGMSQRSNVNPMGSGVYPGPNMGASQPPNYSMGGSGITPNPNMSMNQPPNYSMTGSGVSPNPNMGASQPPLTNSQLNPMRQPSIASQQYQMYRDPSLAQSQSQVVPPPPYIPGQGSMRQSQIPVDPHLSHPMDPNLPRHADTIPHVPDVPPVPQNQSKCSIM